MKVYLLGNDMNDLGAADIFGAANTTAAERPSALVKAKFVSKNRSKHGAVRDLIGMLLAERSSCPH